MGRQLDRVRGEERSPIHSRWTAISLQKGLASILSSKASVTHTYLVAEMFLSRAEAFRCTGWAHRKSPTGAFAYERRVSERKPSFNYKLTYGIPRNSETPEVPRAIRP